MFYLFDVLFVSIVVATTFFLSKRPIVQVAAVWFTFVLASLIALNSFEPIAKFIATTMFSPTDESIYCYAWLAALLSTFALTATLTLMGFAKLMDGVSIASGKAESVGRWCLSFLAAYTLAAFLLTSVHTFPASRDFGGFFPPELHRRPGPIMAMGPDYQMLTLAELVSTPRSPLTGAPWKLQGPLVETNMKSNRWSSFPIRYALWREGVDIKLNDYDVPDDEYSEGDYSEGDYSEEESPDVVAYSL